MAQHTDPRMNAILSRLRRRHVDVGDTQAVILALEDEIDTYRESIRILRDKVDECSAECGAREQGKQEGARFGAIALAGTIMNDYIGKMEERELLNMRERELILELSRNLASDLNGLLRRYDG
ncbi:MAG: hypothetical protein IJ960_00835 [Oscillospiraceae bacterium]|nr:hypothetical protein [Oscillospiraceae bacterium]